MDFKKSKQKPFIIVKNNNGKFIICVGTGQVCEREFDSIKQAEMYINTKPYELIFNTMFYILDFKEHEKKTKRSTKKTAKPIEESTENK